jgi:hypothetical protein
MNTNSVHLAEGGNGAAPIAFAVFADNGNIRLWGRDQEYVKTFAEQHWLDVVPLYAAPEALRASHAALVKALEAAIEREMSAYHALRNLRPGDSDALEDVIDMLSPGMRDAGRAALEEAAKVQP